MRAVAAPALAENYQPVQISDLKVGRQLHVPIYDHRNVLLLAEGKTLTSEFLRMLRQRGLEEVQIHRSELARLCAGKPQGNSTTAREDRKVVVSLAGEPPAERSRRATADLPRLELPKQGEPFAHRITRPGCIGYDEGVEQRFIESQEESVNTMVEAFDSLTRGGSVEMDAVNTVVEKCMSELQQDVDLFACLGVSPFSNDYPARHSLHATKLSLLIGMQLGLDSESLRELSIGCLLHDAGMLMVKNPRFHSNATLNPVEFLDITKHPTHIYESVADQRNIPKNSAFVVYQLHERCNGTGYPRGCKGPWIHPLAKIASVADAFVGMTASRPYRAGLLPYYAVERILKSTKEGAFDPSVVRALLQSVSLFPVGSWVELSDGNFARTIRANPKAYDKPMIELRNEELIHGVPTVIDLLGKDELRIVRPVKESALPKLALETIRADNGSTEDYWD